MLRTILIAAALSLVIGQAARAEEKAMVSFKVLTPEVALELAQGALKSCRDSGFQVAVVVVDRFGILQVAIRDQLAGPHTIETARRKAWTAVSFRTDTEAMADLTQAGKPQSGVRQVPGALMIGGGVPVEAAGAMVAGIGISGAPGGKADDTSARDGIQSIIEKLEF
ncbi:MAG: heme-binding protein [Rhodospirillaceae bacterium]|nr:heme-binding protein [Rhodospirillaceae bacterium]